MILFRLISNVSDFSYNFHIIVLLYIFYLAAASAAAVASYSSSLFDSPFLRVFFSSSFFYSLRSFFFFHKLHHRTHHIRTDLINKIKLIFVDIYTKYAHRFSKVFQFQVLIFCIESIPGGVCISSSLSFFLFFIIYPIRSSFIWLFVCLFVCKCECVCVQSVSKCV